MRLLSARKILMLMKVGQTCFISGGYQVEKSVHSTAKRLNIKIKTELLKTVTKNDKIIKIVMITKLSGKQWGRDVFVRLGRRRKTRKSTLKKADKQCRN